MAEIVTEVSTDFSATRTLFCVTLNLRCEAHGENLQLAVGRQDFVRVHGTLSMCAHVSIANLSRTIVKLDQYYEQKHSEDL